MPNLGNPCASRRRGGLACEGRDQVLAWFRPAPAETPQVDALELLADDDHPLLGDRDHSRQELAGVQRNATTTPVTFTLVVFDPANRTAELT